MVMDRTRNSLRVPGREAVTYPLNLCYLHRIGLVAFVLSLIFVGDTSLQAAAVQAQLDRPTVDSGGTAVLRILIQPATQAATEAPSFPDIPDCEVRYSGMGTQMTYINGVRTDSVIHNYALRPSKEGVLEIPPISVELDGQTYQTQALRLQVTRGMASEDFGFLELITPEEPIYVGQPFHVRLRLLFRVSPRQVDLPSLPTDGFVVGRRPKLVSGQERIGSDIYGVVTSDVVLTPARSGDLTVGPAEWAAIFPVGQRAARRSVFDDPLFQRFFGEERVFTLKSSTNALQVLDPPQEGRPAGFQGAIGRFQMAAQPASPTRVVLGDPVSVRVRVNGIGGIERLRLPNLTPTDAFALYQGTNHFDPGDPLGLSGTKTFELIYVPRQTNVMELPVPKLDFFNPDTRRYESTAVQPIPIQVAPNPDGESTPDLPPGLAVAAGVSDGSSIRQPAQPEEGTPRFFRKARPWALGLGFPVWVALPFGVFAVILLSQRVQSRLAPDRRELQRRESLDRLDWARENLQATAQAGQAGEFCFWMQQALQEQIGLCLRREPGSFTADIIDSDLVAKGLTTETREELRHLFHLIDVARYGATDPELDCQAEWQRVERVLTSLSELETAPKGKG